MARYYALHKRNRYTVTKNEYIQDGNQTIEKPSPDLLQYQFLALVTEITNKTHDECNNRLTAS
jgi:hypothetical protein